MSLKEQEGGNKEMEGTLHLINSNSSASSSVSSKSIESTLALISENCSPRISFAVIRLFTASTALVGSGDCCWLRASWRSSKEVFCRASV